MKGNISVRRELFWRKLYMRVLRYRTGICFEGRIKRNINLSQSSRWELGSPYYGAQRWPLRHDTQQSTVIRMPASEQVRWAKYRTQVQFYYTSSSWYSPSLPPRYRWYDPSSRGMDTMHVYWTFQMGFHFRRRDIKYLLIYILVEGDYEKSCRTGGAANYNMQPLMAPYKLIACHMTYGNQGDDDVSVTTSLMTPVLRNGLNSIRMWLHGDTTGETTV
jgi:hypothetical protein